ncbi:MAG: hypothetical protein ACK481_04190 [Candidatus Melainabacteria bacterium]|jgi:hypothetical protein
MNILLDQYLYLGNPLKISVDSSKELFNVNYAGNENNASKEDNSWWVHLPSILILLAFI